MTTKALAISLITAKSGFSRSTVGHVLKGRAAELRISKRTSERIEQIASERIPQPNTSATFDVDLILLLGMAGISSLQETHAVNRSMADAMWRRFKALQPYRYKSNGTINRSCCSSQR